MIEAIAELGDYSLSKQAKRDPLDLLLEQPNATHVIILSFGHTPVTYRGVEMAECDPAKAHHYFLTPGPSNGPLGSPTAMITEAEKTFNMRLLGWVNKVRAREADIRPSLDPAEFDWLEQFLVEFEQQKDRMLDDLTSQAQLLKGKRTNRLMVTLRFDDGLGQRWIGDPGLPFRSVYRFLMTESLFERWSAQGVCSICWQRRLVSGRVGSEVFRFCTFDKPGFVAGGLDKSLTWHNLPICADCYLRLKVGRDYVEQHMSFRFSGIPYWLVPRFTVDPRQNAEALEVLQLWERRQSLQDKVGRRITGDEEEILELLAKQKDFLTLSFVFIERTQAMERILLSADDVLPSRLRRLFAAKEAVDRVDFLQSANISYDFGRLRRFFASPRGGGREEVSLEPFLEAVAHILRGQPIERGLLLSTLMKRIREDAANMRCIRQRPGHPGSLVTWARASANKSLAGPPETLWMLPIDAWMNLAFLNELGLLTTKPGGENKMQQFSTCDSELVRQLDELFGRYQGTFYNDATKAAFTLGSLTQMLLDVQYRDRRSTPFLKHLKGLRLKPQDLRALLPMVRNKLEEYDQFSPSRRRVAEAASDYLVRADKSLAAMTADEASFYFVLGMNLVQVVWDKLGAPSEAVESP